MAGSPSASANVHLCHLALSAVAGHTPAPRSGRQRYTPPGLGHTELLGDRRVAIPSAPSLYGSYAEYASTKTPPNSEAPSDLTNPPLLFTVLVSSRLHLTAFYLLWYGTLCTGLYRTGQGMPMEGAADCTVDPATVASTTRGAHIMTRHSVEVPTGMAPVRHGSGH